MKKFILVLAMALFGTTAMADGGRHHRHRHHNPHNFHHHHWHHNHGWIAPAILGGAVVYLATRPERVLVQPETVVINPQYVVVDGVTYQKQIVVVDGIAREVLIKVQ